MGKGKKKDEREFILKFFVYIFNSIYMYDFIGPTNTYGYLNILQTYR